MADAEIVVTGNRYRWDGGGYGGGSSGYPDTGDRPDDPSEPRNPPTPPDKACGNPADMTTSEKRDYKAAQEAAKVAAEIMARPERDHNEFASLIWMDTNDDMHHTPINMGGPTMSTLSTEGLPNYGAAIGMIHSHVPDAGVATGREFPTLSDPAGRSDWDAFDYIQNEMYTSLQSNWGLNPTGPTAQEFGQRMSEFRQYILAPTAPSGSGQFVLRGFDTNQRAHDLSNPGQKVPLNLHQCP